MTQWFRGQLEGHYVGVPEGAPAVSQYGSADRFKLRIYRALVRNIEVLESKGEEPERPQQCFYQAKIEDSRLIGIHPRTCFEGTIYDISVSQLRVTHTTKENGKTYGRLEGEVYGRFLLPPEADPEATSEKPEQLEAVSEQHQPGSEDAIAASSSEPEIEPLHPPSAPTQEAQPTNVPMPLLALVVAIVLGLGAGIQPALLWIGLLIPILIVRYALSEQFKVTTGQRVFATIVILVQMGCIGTILLDWLTTDCLVLNPWAIAGIGITALITSVLPSPFPLLLAGAGVAATLFLWFGNVATTCESLEPKRPIKTTIERPTVNDPGIPRTNNDGSWPRRGSRTVE